MNIETKYDLGQQVWPIVLITATEPTPCKTCSDGGWVVINKERFSCPNCHGRRLRPRTVGQKWAVDKCAPGTIGDLRVRRVAEQHGGRCENIYMLDSTGIGSGTLWQEDRLWPSLEEANAECDRLNKGTPA